MDIHDYLGVLRRGWALIVLGVLVGIAGGVAANALQPRTYSATSREILTNSEATGDLTSSLQASSLAQGRVASYVLVATSGLVLQPVIDELALDMTVDQLASDLTVVAPEGTVIVEITATAATAKLAQSIANTVSTVFSDVVENQLENAVAPTVGAPTTDDSTSTTPVAPVRIVNIERASLPTGPTSSSGILLLAVGAILGLALGLVAASLRESLDRRVRGRNDVAAVTDLPVLGQIRPDRSVRSTPTVMDSSPQSAIAESFRGLRASVDHVRERDGVGTFVVTAADPRQGASLVAANLAIAIADTTTTVVVVDANLQAPHQAEIFGIDAGPGLTDLLTTKISLDEVVATGPGENIWVVPIGSRRERSTDLLATKRMRALLAELASRFDVVVIDAASISTATDAAVLGSYGASTLLVVAEGTATRPRLAEALGALAAGGSVPAGVVLNHVPRTTRASRPALPAAIRTSKRVTGISAKPPAAVDGPPAPVLWTEPSAPGAVIHPVTPEIEPEVAPAAEAPVAPVEEKVLDIPPIAITPPAESTSGRAAARAARVAAKAAARAAASRSQQPVSRFAPKPPAAPDALAEAAAAERRSWPAPVVEHVPVLEGVDESSNPVIDVPRGDTGERVSLLTPQPGDKSPEELAEIVKHQFEDDVVYEIPVEAFGSFHQIDAEAFAAIDNEPTVIPPFAHTEPEVAPGTLVIDPVDPLASFSVPGAFEIDLLADEPVYAQPRFEDWALGGQPIEPSEMIEPSVDDTEPEFDASVYERTIVPTPFVYDLEDEPAAPAQQLAPAVESTVPRPFVAPETWPVPRLVGFEFAQPSAQWPAVPTPDVDAPASVEPAVYEIPVVEAAAPAVAQPEPLATVAPEAALARVTHLPSRERLARDSYLLKSRELERAAQERLRYEQQRLEARIREQLEADRRQLAGKLDELLEETVMVPRRLSDGA